MASKEYYALYYKEHRAERLDYFKKWEVWVKIMNQTLRVKKIISPNPLLFCWFFRNFEKEF